MRSASRKVVWIVACLWTVGTAIAQERPLPDPEPFLREVRGRLDTNTRRQLGYAYTETQRRTSVNGRGQRREEAVRVVESYPGLPGEERWEREIERNGRPVAAADLQRADEKRRRAAEAYARRHATQSPRDQTRATEADGKARRERAAMLDDVFLVYEMVMEGRERLEGHDTVTFSLTPRPHARPRTGEGRTMKAFRGRAWISESEFELVRLDVEAIRPVSMALGLLARVHPGTSASFTRRKVNDEAWLPARVSYEVSARVLLLRRIREGGVTDYSNYRKFTVDTATDIRPGAALSR